MKRNFIIWTYKRIQLRMLLIKFKSSIKSRRPNSFIKLNCYSRHLTSSWGLPHGKTPQNVPALFLTEIFFCWEIFYSLKNRIILKIRNKGVIDMKCRLYLCLLVAGVFILAVGRPATASSLIEAASMGDTEKVQLLLAQGADVNARDNDGSTALMAAVAYGHIIADIW